MVSGRKRMHFEEESREEGIHKRSKNINIFKSLAKYSSSDSSDDGSGSESSDYDFIKKAREGTSIIPSIRLNTSGREQVIDREKVEKALNNTNRVATEIFSLLPNAKLGKNVQVMSISGGLRQNKEFKFVDPKEIQSSKPKEEEEEEDDGIINVNKSQLVNKKDYEREKLMQASRADFIREQHEQMSRLMPNKDDRSKNNIRALAYDMSGNLESDRAESQKTFADSRRKYGW
eukprot:CAMPEP_0205803716 /NCGR_PEP_ID=MMETSP0205-20121125/6448_1 /ASSEMBLY_ACC=CAM_ASM_000278 /TAXON_ID=36767 /ORGANISM="Euplotes focardii, Strain TN1" /LENGTH=231 /DNA_ID=CAMNT_0053072229 /DNA_START=32 /DNA_END=724 /DNA_ORIENTATION=+